MGYRLSKIYTRTGDDGNTSLDGKKRIAKNNPRIETIGTLDELNCVIGMVMSFSSSDSEIQPCFRKIQNDLFDLGGELCLPDRPVITSDKVIFLETQLDKWNDTLPPLKEFILPGGNSAAATCHLARAICRRAERCLVTLMQQESIRVEVLQYVNRLSDLLFVAARVLARGSQEILWEHERSKQRDSKELPPLKKGD